MHLIYFCDGFATFATKTQNMIDFITFCDYTGTFAFAISGIRLAAAKQFDWFGAYVVGLVTAVGGGTIRDILLNATPFWMQQSSYLTISCLALLFVIILRKYVVCLNNTFFIFDAIALGLFGVVGIEKALAFGFPMWVAIVMGTITGAFGGMSRDTLINEVPLIFRKDIYALACVLGGLVYYACIELGISPSLTQLIAASSIFLTRILAVKYHISVPVLKGDDQAGGQAQ